MLDRRLLAAVLVIAGCVTTTTTLVDVCTVVGDLDVTSAAPGDEVAVVARPLTSAFDTIVFVDGVQAEITGVDREECSECDQCVVDNLCNACDCEPCDASCASCVETARFVVPDVDAGVQSVVLVNSYGTTDGLVLDVTPGAPDTDDTDLVDTDPPDTDVADTDPLDTDVVDTDPADSDTAIPIDTADTGAADSDTADTAIPADTADTDVPCDTAVDTDCP